VASASPGGDLAALLARTALGERAAFAELYRAAGAKLFGFALRILTRRDLAEECLQEAFVSIWRHAGEFRPDRAQPMTWMTTIVRNRALDMLRAAPPEDGLGEEETMEQWAAADLGPLERAVASQEARALMRCLERLAPRQRQAIALGFFHGLAHEELARRLAQPLGTVKTWIRRGLQQLKNCLGEP
jgi:RNA polymerase sigma-70 factor (ECF subfamily)